MVTTYQYPQYLYALRNGEAAQNPGTGSWKTSPEAWELKGICREETNGKGHVIHTSGGDSTVFSSLIMLPAGTGRINEGTEIIVSRIKADPSCFLSDDFVSQSEITGLIAVKGKCLKYDFGRLHCRLWI